MKFLHTSDWHLGHSLYEQNRYQEHTQFLTWLKETVIQEEIDTLLIAGDIFDTMTPSNRSQETYYRFLNEVAKSNCRHIVIIGGNHDSPSLLNAPKALLKELSIYVIGAPTGQVEDEIITLRDKENKPEAIICAVPYLRDKDVRLAEQGESNKTKRLKQAEGLKEHYHTVVAKAKEKQEAYEKQGFGKLPMLGMGHLFTEGFIKEEDIPDLYVGALPLISLDAFPPCLDYVALGHIHVPSPVKNIEHIRYSGSPIPISFNEAKQQKQVFIITLHNQEKDIQKVNIPCFQELVQIKGTLEEITEEINALKKEESTAWLAIEHTGTQLVSNLCETIDSLLEDSTMKRLRIGDNFRIDQILKKKYNNESLHDLNVYEVFDRCLQSYEVEEPTRSEMKQIYKEVVQSLSEEDVNAE